MGKFVDTKIVKFFGGNGGDGCISMLHLYKNEFAGPDGGNGGNGGHVVLKASKQTKSLNGLSSIYVGNNGERGRGKSQFGKSGEHLFVDVPVGTIVAPASSASNAGPERMVGGKLGFSDPDKSEVLAELDRHGSMFIAARGGAGGRGNATYLSNTNRHPRLAQLGAKGEFGHFEIRMKLYAHFGLIGLPNVGKSTLLRTMTNVQVKVADYSFTTLLPQVGVIQYDDFTQLAISDLPGLIDDSHKNRGLGLQFLRHVQRCVALLYVVDLSTDPISQLRTLFFELEAYKKNLSWRDHLVLANKLDDPRSLDRLSELKEYLEKERPNTKILPISAMRGDNLEELRVDLKEMYDNYLDKHCDDPSEALVW